MRAVAGDKFDWRVNYLDTYMGDTRSVTLTWVLDWMILLWIANTWATIS